MLYGTSDGFLNRAWIFCSELGCAYNVLYISLILRQAKDREGGGIYKVVVSKKLVSILLFCPGYM